MAYEKVMDRIRNGDLILLDGGTGSELERRGAAMNADAWCGPASLENRAILEEVHREFISVGADVITTNTFASSRLLLEPAGFGHLVKDINEAAAAAAIAARDASGNPDILVAGCLSHMFPRRSDGAPGFVDIPDDTARAAAQELSQILAQGGCDLFLLEMMYDPARMPFIFEAAIATGLPVWAGFSVRQGDDGELLSIVGTEDIPFSKVLDILDAYPVDAAGIMHSNVSITGAAIDMLRDRFAGPIMAYPDSGYFKMPHWQFEDIIPPQDFLEHARGWQGQSVQIIGGCCGLGPEHITALNQLRD